MQSVTSEITGCHGWHSSQQHAYSPGQDYGNLSSNIDTQFTHKFLNGKWQFAPKIAKNKPPGLGVKSPAINQVHRLHMTWRKISLPRVAATLTAVLPAWILRPVNNSQCFLTSQQMFWIRRMDMCSAIRQRLFNRSSNINFPLFSRLSSNQW